MEKTEKSLELSFASITPSGIVVPDVIDKKTSRKYISWGEDNKLPDYLFDNYLKCAEFQAIVNTICDYIFGGGIETTFDHLSDEDDTFEEVIKKAVLDYMIFGGFALEGIRNVKGELVRLNYQNVMNVRVDEDLTTAFISNNWGTWNGRDIKELPLFDRNQLQPHFIFYYRGTITRNINPIPVYVAGLKSICILNEIRNFHLRNLENNFSANAIISINGSGIKARELQEIKDKLTAGYTGSENAGKFLLINNPNNDGSVNVERLQADQFGELYLALQTSSVDDVYAAFRINKMLLGKNVATGFSKEEFENAYVLYYNTMIKPLQHNIKRAIRSLGISLEFKEINIEWKN